jgi:hypothetical protein
MTAEPTTNLAKGETRKSDDLSDVFRRREADTTGCARNNSNLALKQYSRSFVGHDRGSSVFNFARFGLGIHTRLQPIRFFDSFDWDAQTYALRRQNLTPIMDELLVCLADCPNVSPQVVQAERIYISIVLAQRGVPVHLVC